jgi:hypothetical protein
MEGQREPISQRTIETLSIMYTMSSFWGSRYVDGGTYCCDMVRERRFGYEKCVGNLGYVDERLVGERSLSSLDIPLCNATR